MKEKTTTGKEVEIEVIESPRRKCSDAVRYRVTDGRGVTSLKSGEGAMEIHRRTFS